MSSRPCPSFPSVQLLLLFLLLLLESEERRKPPLSSLGDRRLPSSCKKREEAIRTWFPVEERSDEEDEKEKEDLETEDRLDRLRHGFL